MFSTTSKKITSDNRKKWTNTYYRYSDVTILVLKHVSGVRRSVFIDSAHYEKISKYSWQYDTTGYLRAAVPGNGGQIRMHQVVLDVPHGQGIKNPIDHINRVKTDNRSINLKHCETKRENDENKGFDNKSVHGLGIYLYRGAYQVQISMNSTRIYNPTFRDKELAMKCRDEFRAIAKEVDKGLRSIPQKEELEAIATRIRGKSIRKLTT